MRAGEGERGAAEGIFADTRSAIAEVECTRGTELIRGAAPEPNNLRALEERCRKSIEDERREAYSPAEWAEAKRNLLAFFAILAEWRK